MHRLTFVIDGSPSSEPLKENEAKLFWRLIDQIGVPRESVRVVALARKPPKEITDEDVVANLPNLWREFRGNKPDVIIGLGLLASKYITGFAKLKDARGGMVPLTIRLPKKVQGGEIPDDLKDLHTTGTAGLGAIWLQEKGQPGAEGKNQFIEDVTRIWQRLNGQSRDARCDYKWLESFEEIDGYFNALEYEYAQGNIPGVIIDIETNGNYATRSAVGLDPHLPDSRIVSIGFSHMPWFCRGIKINHKDERLFSTYGQPVWQAFIERFQKLLNKVPAGGWNFKFDLRWIEVQLGVKFKQTVFFEGLAAHSQIYSELKKHDLKFSIMDELGTPISEAEVKAAMQRLREAGFPEEQCHMGNVDEDLLLTYMGGDVDSTFRLWQRLNPMLDADHCWMPQWFQEKYGPGYNHRFVYDTLMRPATHVFADIEATGVKVDKQMLAHLEKNYPERINAALKPIVETKWGQQLVSELPIGKKKNGKIVTEHMILTSYVNQSRLLYDLAGLPTKTDDFYIPRKDKTKKDGTVTSYYSTKKEFRDKLKEWAHINGRQDLVDLITNIGAYTKLRKLYTSYIVKMHDYIQADGFMRTWYNLTGTRTGRCSTSKPSLHTIPKKSDVKKMFVSRWHSEGGLILQFDYSQLEMRLIGAIADDPTLIAIFESGIDTHRQMAATIFKKAVEDITDDERSKGKTIAFGILYGMGIESLAARTGMTIEEAKVAVDNFFAGLKKVAAWIKKQKKDVTERAVIKPNTGRMADVWDRKKGRNVAKLVDYSFEQYGYIDTIFGRKRILVDANHWVESFKGKAERQAFNTPIQSAASDLALWSLLNLYNRFKEEGLKSVIFGWIHDSIEVDVHPDEFIQVFRIMKEEMEDRPKAQFDWLKKIPIKTSAEVGHGWGFCVETGYVDKEQNKFYLEADNDNVDNLLAVLRSLKRRHKFSEHEMLPMMKKQKDGTEKEVGRRAVFVLTHCTNSATIQPVVKETPAVAKKRSIEQFSRSSFFG